MKYLKHKRTYLIILLLVLDGLFFGLTNPNTVNSVLLIVGFVLLGVTFYLFLEGLISLLKLIGFKIKNSRKIAAFISIILTAAFVLQSLGQLSVRDFFIILLIALLAYAYTSKLKG
jgi:hypothetical protein